MYHQIRHMIGLLIAAYRDVIPKEFISAVLCAPANVALPFAPAQTLVLQELSFGPFARENFRKRDPNDVLRMSNKGYDLQRTFETDTLRPALGQFLHHEDWQTFEDELQEWRNNLDMHQVHRFIETCEKWKADLKQRRDLKQQQRELL